MDSLEHDVLEMASRAETMVAKAVDALTELDEPLAYSVMRADDEIDRMDLDIEARCLKLLALQQPMGTDLREIGSVMKIITDVERIGDLSVDVAKICLKVERELGETGYVDLVRISGLARRMLRLSMEAFVKRDLTLLDNVAELEEQVDVLYRDLRGQVHEYMLHHSDQVVSASWLLLAVHHIERIADHCLNMAERVGFMVTGELSQLAGAGDTA
ncbi:MAG: phosphate signaling complex protein PhoU [Fimbriimonadaceae bacterium]